MIAASSLLADLIPLYAVYALLFADNGMSDAQISGLFAIWSVVDTAAKVPSGALADRYSHKTSLMLSGLFQAAGYLLWLTVPTFTGFAVGFMLWGIGGAFMSGFRGLRVRRAGSERRSGAVHRGVRSPHSPRACGAVVAALVAAPLFAIGSYRLVGMVSVAACLAAAVVASRLPQPPRSHHDEDDDERGYCAAMSAGIKYAARTPAVRNAIIAVGLLSGVDAFEEYVPLLARDWGVSTVAIPLATVGIPLVAALGAAYAWRADRLTAAALVLFAAWAVGSLALTTAGVLLLAAALPRWLRRSA